MWSICAFWLHFKAHFGCVLCQIHRLDQRDRPPFLSDIITNSAAGFHYMNTFFLCRSGSRIAEQNGERGSVLVRCNRSEHISPQPTSFLFWRAMRTTHRYTTATKPQDQEVHPIHSKSLIFRFSDWFHPFLADSSGGNKFQQTFYCIYLCQCSVIVGSLEQPSYLIPSVPHSYKRRPNWFDHFHNIHVLVVLTQVWFKFWQDLLHTELNGYNRLPEM